MRNGKSIRNIYVTLKNMSDKTKVLRVQRDFCENYLDPLIEEANAKNQTSIVSTLALYVGIQMIKAWGKEGQIDISKLAGYLDDTYIVDQLISKDSSFSMLTPEEVMRNPHDFFSFLRKHEKERKEYLERCSRNMSAEDVKRLEQTILTTEDNGYG